MSDERVDKFRRLLNEGEPSTFGPFFASRVMQRIEREETNDVFESIDAALRWGFARVATAAAVLAIAVGVYSALGPGDLGVYTSTLESVLGLPSQSLDTVFLLSGV